MPDDDDMVTIEMIGPPGVDSKTAKILAPVIAVVLALPEPPTRMDRYMLGEEWPSLFSGDATLHQFKNGRWYAKTRRATAASLHLIGVLEVLYLEHLGRLDDHNA